MRCRAHGLAAGPDGRCVLCRDTERPATDDAFPLRRVLTLLAAGGLLITAAALAVRVAVGTKPVVEAEERSGEVDSLARSASPQAPLVRGNEEPSAIAAAPHFAEAPARPAPLSPLAPESASSAAVADAGPVSTPGSGAPTPPSNSAIQAALKQTSIVMFATSWCSHCTRARGFLDANGLRREERDVDHDPRARAELKRLTGEASVPVFLVDGELVKGFSEKGMTRVLVASVEKRLGVRGIRVRTAEGR